MLGQIRASEKNSKRGTHKHSCQPSHYQENNDEYMEDRQTQTTATLEQAKQEEEDKIDLTGRQDAWRMHLAMCDHYAYAFLHLLRFF